MEKITGRKVVTINRRDVVTKRRHALINSERRHTFKKGDKRVSTPRLCVVCGRPLTSLVINDNRYVTIQSHIHCHLSKDVTVDICEDVHSCYRTLRRKGELEDVNDR